MIKGELMTVEVLLDEGRQCRNCRRSDLLDAVSLELAHIQPRHGDVLVGGCPSVDLNPPSLVDGRVRKAESESTDKVVVVEVGPATPTKGEARHSRHHPGSVVDDGKTLDDGPLPIAALLECDINAGGTCLHSIVHEFTDSRRRVAISAPADRKSTRLNSSH